MNMNLYFAYGSNMSTKRITAEDRCPNAKFFAVATLPEWEFVFNKPMQQDQTHAYANIRPKKGGLVWGIIFTLSDTELAQLDIIEGPRYQRTSIQVLLSNGNTTDVYAYIADANKPSLPPTENYLKLITDGANEYHLPEEYVLFLKTVKN